MGEYALVRVLTGPSTSSSFGLIYAVTAAGGSAPGAGDVFVSASGGVYEFNASGEFLDRVAGTPSESFESPGPVAVDPGSGRLFVNNGAIDVFSGALVVPDVVTEGIANAKYEPGSQAWALDLTGSVNPDGAGPATCRFMWGKTPALGSEARCEGPGENAANPVPNGSGAVGVHARVSGLPPDTSYYYRLEAFNENGSNEGEEAQDREFTAGGPSVNEESASSVTSTSVTLNAEVDPNNSPTSYYFQYGTSAAYGESVPLAPGAELGSGKGYVGASVHLQGLATGAAYHYRVVAVGNGVASRDVMGADEKFTTQAGGSEFTLPDGRAWELVTPLEKQGAGIITIGGSEYGDDIQAAQSGDGITYDTTAPIVADPAGSRSLEATQAISLRGASGVWGTQDIATPHNEGAAALPIGETSEYKLFSDDLSLGFVQPVGDTPLGSLPVGSEKTVYLREADGEYEALVTSGNVQPGCKFGGLSETYGGVKFVDATPDMSHVLVTGPGCLYPGGADGLYEWSEGGLRPVGVLPDGEIVGGGLAGVRRGISNDGSRVVWESGGVLYLRDMVSGETVQVAEGASFRIGDGDESRLFFTSGGSLDVFEVTSGSGQPLAGEIDEARGGRCRR